MVEGVSRELAFARFPPTGTLAELPPTGALAVDGVGVATGVEAAGAVGVEALEGAGSGFRRPFFAAAPTGSHSGSNVLAVEHARHTVV